MDSAHCATDAQQQQQQRDYWSSDALMSVLETEYGMDSAGVLEVLCWRTGDHVSLELLPESTQAPSLTAFIAQITTHHCIKAGSLKGLPLRLSGGMRRIDL